MTSRILKSILPAIVLLLCNQAITAQTSSTTQLNKPRLLASGFAFTEGPAADSQGNIYFTDQPNNRIYCYTTKGKLTLFTEKSGRANGLFFDGQNNLWACSDEQNEIWRFDPQATSTPFLTKGYEGKKFNGPNDLWVSHQNIIYFTDPWYQRPWWNHTRNEQIATQQVYALFPAENRVIRVTTDLLKPNGIVGTPDGKHLFVADIEDGKTWKFDIQPDGTLSNKTLFTPMGSDGMAIDPQGNLYLTGKGVTIFNASGQQIGHIAIDSQWTSNVGFGGKKNKTLFITATESLYAVTLKNRHLSPEKKSEASIQIITIFSANLKASKQRYNRH